MITCDGANNTVSALHGLLSASCANNMRGQHRRQIQNGDEKIRRISPTKTQVFCRNLSRMALPTQVR